MKFELNEAERDYLLDQLRDQLGSLRGQVHHVTITKFSEQLKEQIALIRGLIEKLEHAETSDAAAPAAGRTGF